MPSDLEEARPYTLGRAGQMSSEQIGAIVLMNDNIARTLTHTMGAWLRTQIQVSLVSADPLPFSEYLRLMPDRICTYVLRLDPVGGMALLQMELSLAQSIINLLLGGNGELNPAAEVTEIEEGVLQSVLNVVLRELNAAWDKMGLRFEMEHRETMPNVARLMQPSDRTLAVAFSVQIGEGKSTFQLCLPSVVLNSIHRRLVAIKDAPRKRLEGTTQRVGELLGHARVRAVLRLPPVAVSAQQVAALEEGDVLPLRLSRNTTAELYAGGVRLLAAVPVGQGEKRAALVPRTPAEKAAVGAVLGEDRRLEPAVGGVA